VQIVAKGEQRFTNYTGYYALEATSSTESREIVRRSDIFHARKTIIEMGSVLGF
jgi:hypothetical protein